MEPTDLPLAFNVDDGNDPHDLLEAVVLGAFAAGRFPCARSTNLSHVRPDATLLPPGATVLRTAEGDVSRAVLSEGPGWLLRTKRWRDGDAFVDLVAATEELAAEVLRAVTADVVEEPEVGTRTVPFSFWHARGDGRGRCIGRRLVVPAWAEIRRNYARAAADALDRLMALTPEELAGRLLLLHGPPGTGKTSALRALADAWSSWCDVDVVIDPERLYADTAYLNAVLLGDEPLDDDRWRLLVLEDCEELMRADARAGQALGRLLNVADGLLGQGLRLVVAMTTNERIGELHPAVTRPGRCLAEVYVGPLSATEAATWLGGPAPAGGATLAELFDRAASSRKVRTGPAAAATGQYL